MLGTLVFVVSHMLRASIKAGGLAAKGSVRFRVQGRSGYTDLGNWNAPRDAPPATALRRLKLQNGSVIFIFGAQISPSWVPMSKFAYPWRTCKTTTKPPSPEQARRSPSHTKVILNFAHSAITPINRPTDSRVRVPLSRRRVTTDWISMSTIPCTPRLGKSIQMAICTEMLVWSIDTLVNGPSGRAVPGL